jgi:hypothetical protein
MDGLVLDFLARTTFHTSDFTRVSDGACRLHPQLARAVVAACRVSQERIDAHVRWLADLLLDTATRSRGGARAAAGVRDGV